MLSTALTTLKNCPDLGRPDTLFDEPKDRLYERLYCMEAGITYRQLLEPNASVRERLAKCKQVLTHELFTAQDRAAYVRYPDLTGDPDEVLKHHGFDFEAVIGTSWTSCKVSQVSKVLVCVDLFQRWPSAEGLPPGD